MAVVRLRRRERPGSREATPASADDRLRHPEFAAAIDRRRGSFDYYLEARFGAHDQRAGQAERDAYQRYTAPLLDAYEAHAGRICASFYCKHLVAGAVRTDKPRLAFAYNSDRWGREEELLASCDGLYWEAIDYLGGTDKTTFVERLFAVVTDLLGRLDNREAPVPRRDPPSSAAVARDEALGRSSQSEVGGASEPADAALATLARKLDDVRKFYREAAPRRARLRYLLGVVIGIPLVAAVGYLLALLLGATTAISALDRELIMTSLVSGGTGAVVSVMARLGSETLDVKHESGKWALFLAGLMRPVLGGVFGVAVFAAVSGALVTLAAPTKGDEIFYYAALGFLAGFSERFAQDTLFRSGAGNAPREGSQELRPPPK
jgi:hypothetical protein